MGYGGVSGVARATGMSRTTIHQGLAELDQAGLSAEQSRRRGGGRTKIRDKDASILKHLGALVDPSSRGHPMSPLRWTSKSTRQLADALGKQGHSVSYRVVGEMLKHLGYSLQANMKTLEEGRQHPDRDEQFVVYIENGVLNYTLGRQVEDADATVSIDRDVLDSINLGETTITDAIQAGDVVINGNADKFMEFLGLLDRFELWFNIVTP